MIAHFYIFAHSFLYNGIDNNNEIAAKLLKFKRMIDEARQYDDNKFYIQADNFLETIILPNNITITQLINNIPDSNKIIGRDCLNLFMTLFKYSQRYPLSKEELLEYLELEDKNTCHGILVLNLQNDLPNNHQVISTVEGWLRFRRFYLGKYPENPEHFLREANKYYKRLFIHPQNKNKFLREILITHSKQIVEYLSALNDDLIDDYKKFAGDFVQFLPIFAGNHNIDAASFEGSKDPKFKFTFNVKNKDIEIYCEPHLKMYKDDSGNHNQHGRIYFQVPQEEDSHIYIGAICKHL